jgi:hypothetical protein
MIKSFNEYIGEGRESNFSKYSLDVINLIKNIKSTNGEYLEIRELEYRNPDFDLVIELKLEEDPDFDNDSHFNSLSWEEINFRQYGFAIDANVYINKGDLILPEIIITLLLQPSRIPGSYEELNYRLIDIISHETNHTLQVGWNREPFKVRPSSNSDRKSAKKSFKYFILPDEVESMVKGAYERSKAQGVRIDKIFDKYLYPFLMVGKINQEQYNQVLSTWIKDALENYPDADLSIEDQKIKNIVDKI